MHADLLAHRRQSCQNLPTQLRSQSPAFGNHVVESPPLLRLVGEWAITMMYGLNQDPAVFTHSNPSSSPQIGMYAASWCARFWQCPVSRPKEIPDNYSKTISLEYYRVALREYRHRFHPVNDLAPYIRLAGGGVSLDVQCKTNSNTSDLCLGHLRASIPSHRGDQLSGHRPYHCCLLLTAVCPHRNHMSPRTHHSPRCIPRW